MEKITVDSASVPVEFLVPHPDSTAEQPLDDLKLRVRLVEEADGGYALEVRDPDATKQMVIMPWVSNVVRVRLV